MFIICVCGMADIFGFGASLVADLDFDDGGDSVETAVAPSASSAQCAVPAQAAFARCDSMDGVSEATSADCDHEDLVLSDCVLCDRNHEDLHSNDSRSFGDGCLSLLPLPLRLHCLCNHYLVTIVFHYCHRRCVCIANE